MDAFTTIGFCAFLLACCGFADRLGRILGVVDRPDGLRKTHAKPTPLVGGVALIVPLLWITVSEALRQPRGRELFLVLGLAAFGSMALGWFDDRRQTAPGARLVLSVLLCGFLLLLDPSLRLVSLDFGRLEIPLGMLAAPFTVLCLVGLQNAINMADGLNGLLISLGVFWTGCLLLYAPDHLSPYLLFLLLGLVLLLPFNLTGRLFLGDAGSYSLGLIIGLLMISVHHQAAGALPMATNVLWLLIPVLDCLRVMTERILAHRSPLSADRNHLHHWVLRRWPAPKALLVYLAIAALPGAIAALWPAATVAMLLVALTSYTATLGWIVRSCADRDLRLADPRARRGAEP